MKFLKLFGTTPSEKDLHLYEQSSNWDGKKFVNLETTVMEFSWGNLPEFIRKQLFDKEGREPDLSIPIQAFDKEAFLAPSDKMKAIWYGHSALLLRIKGKTLLIDPMLGDNASPIAPFATKRFSEDSLALIDQFPEIDLVLLTHDHYDHLDMKSILKLKDKTRAYYVAMGVGRHLSYWGIAAEKITEFDWWDKKSLEDIDITFTPSRHFSGRGLTDRAKSLWGGWVFKTENENLYFSGDGGYGAHFKEVGKRLGPFDFGWMECGQYNENWHQIHMYPEESVQAALDAGVKKATPVHWAGFALALHTWTDPVERFMAEAKKQQLNSVYPQIGEIISTSSTSSDSWWKEMESLF
ncbi:MAG: MBL fold metallo-hydrolase [Bacteroidota bacterium]